MDGSPDRRRWVASALIAGVALVLYLALVWRFDFLIDDAFISFRYAKHWAEGHGLRYNLGGEAPVEGFSNFLWVCALALLRLASVPLEIGSRVLSVACGATSLAFVVHALRARLGAGVVATAGAAVFLALEAPFAVWSTGGLETAAFGLVFLGLVLLLAGEPSARRGALAGLCALALALLRVEGLAWALVAGAISLVAHLVRRNDRPFELSAVRACTLAFLAVLLGGYGALLLARHAYYGTWVSNTVHAKAVLTGASLLRGGKYVAAYLLVVPAALLAHLLALPGLARPREPLVFLTAWLSVGFLAYVFLVGGDWMPMFRFLAPAAPLLALAAGATLARLRPRVAAALGLALLLLDPLPSLDRFLVPHAVREALYFRDFKAGYQTEVERVDTARDNTIKYTVVGKALKQVAPPGTTIVAGAIGAHGYYSELYVWDRNGLVNREVALLPSTGEGSAGHDKRVPRSFFLKDHPTWVRFAVADRIPHSEAAPLFRTVIHGLGASVFHDPDAPDDAILRDRTIARILPLEPDPSFPPEYQEASLLVLEVTDDVAAARAFWARFGL